jgi:dienelactone hydrolase
MKVTRRRALAGLGASAAGLAFSPAAAFGSEANRDSWQKVTCQGRRVYQQGTGERAVVLLHEIDGLSDACIEFGQQLADKQFRVYLPLLFGHLGEDDIVLGTLQSCVFGGFQCDTTGPELTLGSAPVRWVRSFVSHLEIDATIEHIGVIGMCQSGAFPLATMRAGSKVRAAVLSQPALPFGDAKQQDVGLDKPTLEVARESGIPMLGFRFAADTICTQARFDFLQSYFKDQFHAVTFDHCACTQTMTHRCHAVLTGVTADVKTKARAMVQDFLRDRLV